MTYVYFSIQNSVAVMSWHKYRCLWVRKSDFWFVELPEKRVDVLKISCFWRTPFKNVLRHLFQIRKPESRNQESGRIISCDLWFLACSFLLLLFCLWKTITYSARIRGDRIPRVRMIFTVSQRNETNTLLCTLVYTRCTFTPRRGGCIIRYGQVYGV